MNKEIIITKLKNIISENEKQLKIEKYSGNVAKENFIAGKITGMRLALCIIQNT